MIQAFLLKNQSAKVSNDAAGNCNREKSESFPCHKDADNQSKRSCKRCGGGIDDCRKGHNRKCDIGYIIQEGTDKPVFDRLADQRQRKHADQLTGDRYDCNVDINISTHTFAPCSFCASAFSGVISVCGGKRHAAIPAMISVRMIVRVPLEMSRITGRRLHR